VSMPSRSSLSLLSVHFAPKTYLATGLESSPAYFIFCATCICQHAFVPHRRAQAIAS
jgi:hypothetical protein